MGDGERLAESTAASSAERDRCRITAVFVANVDTLALGDLLVRTADVDAVLPVVAQVFGGWSRGKRDAR